MSITEISQLEVSLTPNTISDNIDEIYNALVDSGQTPFFVSVCYRTGGVQTEVIDARSYRL